MADWTGHGMPAGEQYRLMGEQSFAGVSPSYQAIAFAVVADAGFLTLLDALPPPKRQPNLLLGAVRLLGGPVDDPAAFLDWTRAHWDDVVDVVMTHRTQTNEARRCATLLPLLAALPGPLALVEVGASAGLCLLPDRYAYRYGVEGRTVEVGRSALTLTCEVTGPAPLPQRVPEVVWRRGLDLHPLDVTDDDDARWLQALVWPEQTERFDILSTALAIARDDPPEVVQGDLLTDLAPLVHSAPVDATVVVFHSAVLAYLGSDDRRRFAASLDDLGRDVVWVSNEAPGIVVASDAPPGERFLLARDGAAVAWTGPHGHTLDWM